ncbi:glycoside hydrolase family 108 protein [Devosia sp.]|uniref:glycoside hydrolase family 108 protein n=1 Tax=Devosia sp. TaxID=1871048 RepID=UPI0025FD7E98|nr:glycoside hydrolase family 108 protein [Devosia sp.]MCR6633997.1 glycoside hydrolase family 108 protein [Devosia sp.]
MANDERFQRCLTEVLRHEGGYVDHPSDPGGATNMGITRKTLARWRKISPWTDLPKSSVASLKRDEAALIYRANYWNPSRAGDMPAGVDLALFDFAVNSGPDRAVRTLQAALGVAADGEVGPVTLAALRAADLARLLNDFCDRRLAFLKGLSTFVVFGRGWTRRVADIRAAALADLKTSSSTQRRVIMTMLSGYRTYIVAAFMIVAGLAQVLGVELPTLDGGSAGSLILEALAIIFLRKGLKGDAA